MSKENSNHVDGQGMVPGTLLRRVRVQSRTRYSVTSNVIRRLSALSVFRYESTQYLR